MIVTEVFQNLVAGNENVIFTAVYIGALYWTVWENVKILRC
jgi:hypothetical protein